MSDTKTITEMLADLSAGQYSSEELVQTQLARIKASDHNAFVTVDDDIALAAARAADKARANGDTSPLLGIPIAHKDIYCTKGQLTTAASHILEGFVPPYNATVVEKLETAGAVSVGKTNMDEFAMGSSNENSHYGPAKNPWDPDRIPGGSSGGTAVAVSAGLVPGATGTDTGGSIRQPAAMCGVTGIKPTYGRVSRWGIIAYASSLDQAGPMARTAEDAALLLEAMAGFDPKDSTSIDAEVPNYRAQLDKSVAGLKIGLCKQYFEDGLHPAIESAIQEAIRWYESQGAIITEVDLPTTKSAIPAYYVIAPAEASANLARYDGVRFGHRCEQPDGLADLFKRSRSEGFGTEVKQRIMVGTFALSAGYYDAYYRKAQQIRRLIKNDFQAAFADVDLILGPTTPTPAFKIGEKSDDQVEMYLQDIYTITANLSGLPAASIPVGFVEGLPVGMQLIGNYLDEGRILNAAHQFQLATDWHLKRPGDAV